MEVLLLSDVPGVGKKNDLLVVGDGFALNCLLPKRAALVATPLVRKRYAEFIRRRAEEREKEKEAAAATAGGIAGLTVTLTRKATKTGKLYAAIAPDTIAQALHDQHGYEVSEQSIALSEQIKAVGTHTVTVHLQGQKVQMSVEVKAEG